MTWAQWSCSRSPNGTRSLAFIKSKWASETVREEKGLFIFPPAVLIFVKDIHAIAGPGGAGEFEQERGPLPSPRCTSQSPVARLEFWEINVWEKSHAVRWLAQTNESLFLWVIFFPALSGLGNVNCVKNPLVTNRAVAAHAWLAVEAMLATVSRPFLG